MQYSVVAILDTVKFALDLLFFNMILSKCASERFREPTHQLHCVILFKFPTVSSGVYFLCVIGMSPIVHWRKISSRPYAQLLRESKFCTC